MASLPALNFDLGEAADMLRSQVESFSAAEIAPRAAQIDRDNEFPMDLWPKMGALGVLGVTVEEEYGGAGMGYLEHVVAMEEISRASASVGLSYGAHSNLCVNQIRRNGTEEQKRRYLPGLINGTAVGALAIVFDASSPGANTVYAAFHGRGVAVSKSDFATYAFALLALEATKPTKGTVELHLTYDEEVGGEIGPGHLLKSGLSKPDLVICAGFSYAVVAAHNGCLHLEITVRGRSAHAASPDTGIDALEAASHVLATLYAWRRGLATRVSKVAGIGAAQMTVGLIKGGINTNVVPDAVTLRLDRRMIPEEDAVAVEAELQEVISKAGQAFPKTTVEVRRILLARPLTATPASRRIAEVLAKRASEVLDETIPVTGVPLYTDARHYAERGIPTVLYGAGPRSILEANAHRADERLKLDDLNAATKVIALALGDLLA